jgi:hypothetical protein
MRTAVLPVQGKERIHDQQQHNRDMKADPPAPLSATDHERVLQDQARNTSSSNEQ